jgi:hypothetical protein
VYDTNSVDAAVASLNAVVQDAMEQAIPRGYSKKSKFPHWFSNSLRYYITKKNYFYRRFKKKETASLYDAFSFYRKRVKATMKTDRLRWLESIDANLKSQPKQFWKYLAFFRKKSSTSIQLVVDGTRLVDPCEVADAFANHFQLIYEYNNPSSGISPSLSSSSELLTLSPISDSDIF